ncbi:MAG TPA: alpha/beta hydrolase-fold protein [Polyangiales bacterium]|nr:alpha/beta hydrolase-fold protein [Polyangiales bacterium]
MQGAQPERGVLEAHSEHSYALALAERECAFGSLRPWGGLGPAASNLTLIVREPGALSELGSAPELRRFSMHTGAIELGFCVEQAGSYGLEVKASETGGGYELALEHVLPRGTPKRKPAPAADNQLSPHLQSVAGTLSEPDRLEQFWRDTARAGTPLIEPAEADTSWVTFLYRGAAETREVSINWQMWSGELALNQLAHLPGTDVWWRSLRLPNATRASYQLTIDPPVVDDPNSELTERAQVAVTRADPLNHRTMLPDSELDAFAQRSVLQLPAATPERWLQPKSKPPAGRLEQQRLSSKQLEHEHALTVYLPAGYAKQPSQAYPLIIFFDGEDYLRMMAAPRLLDALIAGRAISPVVALFVHNDDPNQRAAELPCNAAFAAFVADELLPFARDHYRLSNETGLAGSSFGGLASSFIALRYPDRFGKVLSQSGSFWWSFPADHASYDGSDKPGWLRRRYAERPPASTQFYLSAGIFEGSIAGDGVLEQNRLQRDALRAAGYSVAYQEFVGGHDHLAWRATLPDGLIALYAPPP